MTRLIAITVLTFGFAASAGCSKESPTDTSQVTPVQAAVTAGNPDQGQRPEGMQEAIAACANATEGTACSFTTPKGQLTGICMKSPRDQQLACRPARPDGGHGPGEHPMMEDAFEACAGKTAGADCSFKCPAGDIKGKCTDRNGKLFCHCGGEECPRWHGKGMGMDDTKMKAACATLAEGKSCTFEGLKGSVTGTCKKGYEGDQLLCLPEKPKSDIEGIEGKNRKGKGKATN